jgi:cell division septation protein DedD
MTSTDCATEIAAPDIPQNSAQDSPTDGARPSAQASKPLKGLLFGFAATVTVGLALGSWYVGIRIVAADEVTPSNRTSAAPVSPAPAPLPTPAPPSVAAPPAAAPVAAPPDLYLQVAALGPRQDGNFVKSLEGKGFSAQIETKDNDSARILIGPFSNRAAMEQGQRELQSSGVLAVETER